MNAIISSLVIVGKLAASASVSAVVGNLIAIKTPANVKPLTKISLGLGTFILSAIASDMAMTYVENQATEILEAIVQTKDAIEEQMAAQETPVQEEKKEGEG